MKKRIIATVLALTILAAGFLIAADYREVDAASVKKGASGTVVRSIQTKLKNWGYYSGTVDGSFGAKTEAAVKSFQKKNKLTADGVVGAKTAAAMGVTLSGTVNKTSGTTSADLNLLARCIYGEARGEPYTGKVAVGAIILNRVKSAGFPNSISGVIYQPRAFTAVSDGQINLGTNDECLRAAQDALNGWDPTYGCIYYYNPVIATSTWIRSRQIKLTIGKHVFCV